MTTIIELFIGGLFLTAGDIVFKTEIKDLPWYAYAAGLGLYLIGLIFLVRTYESENIAVASALIVIFNIVTLTFVSWLVFKEAMTPLQILGITLSFGAIALLHP